MGKKQHHEEHVNHERWLVSFADMMTLLFALFVVLYAIGETKLRKLQDLKKSVAFALNMEGEGKTMKEGVFDRGEVGGELLSTVPMINAQSGAMKEFLLEQLPDEFEQRTGKSLEVLITDDTIAFTGPMSAFFEPNRVAVRADITAWIGDLISSATTFASNVRVLLQAPDVQISRNPNQTANRTSALCHRRNEYLLQLLTRQPHVNPERITTEFKFLPPTTRDWEEVGTVTIAFANR
ncbi:MAG: hypothetical protein KDB80_05550 [Planctomycetes bacterium]|nr:hypothetical protein [Planctomycetota bacterium]